MFRVGRGVRDATFGASSDDLHATDTNDESSSLVDTTRVAMGYIL